MNRIVQLFSLVLLLGVTDLALGQSNTIRIENGQLFVNGTLQPKDKIPSGLDLEGLSANLSFSGATQFRLGNLAFAIQDGLLVETEPRGDDFVVFVGRENPSLFSYSTTSPSDELLGAHQLALRDSPVRVFYEVLDGRLAEMEELHTEFARTKSVSLARRMQEESAETADLVKAFPRVELQTYLADLQDRNAGLYDGMVKEQLMEMETRRLASRIVATDDPARKAELREELTSRLEEIFELKQANRRAEIDQLDTRLRELRSQMDAREDRRRELIEARIQQLLTPRHPVLKGSGNRD